MNIHLCQEQKTYFIRITCLDISTDGVAVVIYNMMNTFAEMSHNGDPIPVTQVILK